MNNMKLESVKGWRSYETRIELNQLIIIRLVMEIAMLIIT
jgi:hypothetical protein